MEPRRRLGSSPLFLSSARLGLGDDGKKRRGEDDEDVRSEETADVAAAATAADDGEEGEAEGADGAAVAEPWTHGKSCAALRGTQLPRASYPVGRACVKK